MPIPRRFDRTPPERDSTRINERIRVPQVRLVSENGEQIGVMDTRDALTYAQERDLDLVEVAADAKPPVCRVLDYSKYKYQQEQKAKEARRHQQQVTIREIKLRPKIATNDYETKRGHVRRFLERNNKVKITIMFRGRETQHPERGEMLLQRLADDVADVGIIEQRPNLDGRNMTMLLGPTRRAVAEAAQKPQEEKAAAREEKAKAESRPDAEPQAEPVAEEAPAAEAAEEPAADEAEKKPAKKRAAKKKTAEQPAAQQAS